MTQTHNLHKIILSIIIIILILLVINTVITKLFYFMCYIQKTERSSILNMSTAIDVWQTSSGGLNSNLQKFQVT